MAKYMTFQRQLSEYSKRVPVLWLTMPLWIVPVVILIIVIYVTFTTLSLIAEVTSGFMKEDKV